MKKLLTTLIMGAMILFYGTPSALAVNEAQNKLLAKRAAQADAYRTLAETVMGFNIDANTYVRDFVDESDQIQTDLNTFLKGAEVTNVFYLPDGTCEVTVSMTIQQIVTELQTIHRARYVYIKGRRRWRLRDFDQIVVHHPQLTFVTAKGSGVPRSSAQNINTNKSNESIVTANIPGWEGVTPQGRLMAERAAKTDAVRNLAETVYGLRITSQTYVRDFVAESDQIQTMLDQYIKNVKQISPYRYTPEGICEVDVEVSVQDVIKQLKTIHQDIVRRGWRWRTVEHRTINFEEIIGYTPIKIIRATGSGVPPEKYRQDRSPTSAGLTSFAPPTPAWATSTIQAKGTGIQAQGISPAEAYLSAERAAKIDALRNLSEQIYGVRITSQTTVRDFVTQYDEVSANVTAFLQGAREIETRELPDGSIEVVVELPLNGLYQILKPRI